MIIKNITNVKSFFETVDRCEGRVELLTSQGDRLNLKSKLSQYVSFSGMFDNANIAEMEILVSNPEDITLLMEYLVRG